MAIFLKTGISAEQDAADIARVRAHLAAGGWPLAAPDRTSS